MGLGLGVKSTSGVHRWSPAEAASMRVLGGFPKLGVPVLGSL